MVLLHGGFASSTVHRGSARLLGAVKVLGKMASAASIVPSASARLLIARLLPNQEDCVSGMGAAARKCATLKAARLVLLHAAVASGMVHMAGVRLMGAPLRHDKGSSTASHTAAGRRRSRAPWRAAPPFLTARASVVNTAVAKGNAGSLTVLIESTAFSRPAGSTVGVGTASTHQDASCQQPSTAQTARSTQFKKQNKD